MRNIAGYEIISEDPWIIPFSLSISLANGIISTLASE
jgi:hypothetical protein